MPQTSCRSTSTKIAYLEKTVERLLASQNNQGSNQNNNKNNWDQNKNNKNKWDPKPDNYKGQNKRSYTEKEKWTDKGFKGTTTTRSSYSEGNSSSSSNHMSNKYPSGYPNNSWSNKQKAAYCMENRVCFNCFKTGHQKNDCPTAKRDNTTQNEGQKKQKRF